MGLGGGPWMPPPGAQPFANLLIGGIGVLAAPAGFALALLDSAGHTAQSGTLRLPNGGSITARNAANTVDYNLISLSATNTLVIGDVNIPSPSRIVNGSHFSIDVSSNPGAGLNFTAGSNISFMTPTACVFSTTVASLASNQVGPSFRIDPKPNDNPTTFLNVTGQAAYSAGAVNVDGGGLRLQGGAARTNGTTGLRGGVRCQLGGDNTQTMIECAEVVLGSRVVALCQLGAGVTAALMPAGTGDGVAWIGNAQTVPTANPTGGGILFATAGALKYRGSGGTVTTLGAA